MQVGFVGTGVMGSAMVRCLLEAGHIVTIYDVRRDSANEICRLGARWAESPSAVGHASEVVFTSLPGPKEMEVAVLDPLSGILGGLREGSAYIDTTTNSVFTFRKVAAACREKNVVVLDAPVSGRPPGMTMMVGGDETTFLKYHSLLAALSSKIFYVGESGKGMVVKAINQYLICASFLAGAEGLLLGVKAGIDPLTLHRVLSASRAGRTLDLEPFREIVFKREFKRGRSPGGPLKRWVKDVGCAAEVARSLETAFPVLDIAEKSLLTAQSHDLGEEVWYAVIRVLEDLAKVELRAQTKPE